MKTLYLLRHADAAYTFNETDKNRALTPKGQDDAVRLGQNMHARGDVPAVILCSSATRTRQTLAAVGQAVDITHAQIIDYLYNAPAGDLLSTIQGAPNGKDSVMIVAHNPGIHELAVRLLRPICAEKLGFSYPPCTLSVIECDIESWADIQFGVNVLVDRIT